MSLLRHSAYNLAGYILPTLIAIPSLGVISRCLGIEAFGIFMLIFAFVGYSSIFDAGLTRAVIREVSIHKNNEQEQLKILSTSTAVVFILGIFAAVLLNVFSLQLIHFLKVSEIYFQDIKFIFYLLAVIIPIYLVNQIWLAYLEGEEQFAILNIQRTVTSSILAGLPAILVYFYGSLISAVYGIVISRMFSLVVTYAFSSHILKKVRPVICFDTLKRMIKYGSWLTVSNIISPVMTYFDRFIISNVLGADNVAFYSAPAEGISRLSNVPFALSRALFPKISSISNKLEKKSLEDKSYFIISVVCLPIVIIAIIFSHLIMSTWMGESYADKSSVILQILLIGFYFNSLAQIPYSVLQASGFSRATALIHCTEVIPYLLILYVLTSDYGLTGTAIAWSLRMVVDFLILYCVRRKMDEKNKYNIIK